MPGRGWLGVTCGLQGNDRARLNIISEVAVPELGSQSARACGRSAGTGSPAAPFQSSDPLRCLFDYADGSSALPVLFRELSTARVALRTGTDRRTQNSDPIADPGRVLERLTQGHPERLADFGSNVELADMRRCSQIGAQRVGQARAAMQ